MKYYLILVLIIVSCSSDMLNKFNNLELDDSIVLDEDQI